jgi:hypothetical protein
LKDVLEMRSGLFSCALGLTQVLNTEDGGINKKKISRNLKKRHPAEIPTRFFPNAI